jgi:soluble P-type ATPase
MKVYKEVSPEIAIAVIGSEEQKMSIEELAKFYGEVANAVSDVIDTIEQMDIIEGIADKYGYIFCYMSLHPDSDAVTAGVDAFGGK